MTLPLPPLQNQILANAFDLLLLQPSRSLQPSPRPLLVPAPCVPRLFRLLFLSLVLLCQRAMTPPVIFPHAPFGRWNTQFQHGPCFSSCFRCGH